MDDGDHEVAGAAARELADLARADGDVEQAVAAGRRAMQAEARAVADRRRALGVPTPRADKVGRNQPCPCGSGKQYKRCGQGAIEAL